MFKDVIRASIRIYKPLMVHTLSFLLKTTLKITYKMSDVGHPLCTGKRMVCCNEIHPLPLLMCCSTFLRCIRMAGGAKGSIFKACYGQYYVITTKNDSQISCKISAFGHIPCTGNGMMCYKETHPLFLECFVNFPRYIRVDGKAPDII